MQKLNGARYRTQKYDFIVCNNVLTELCSDKEKTSITILLYGM